jgi:hypothetical protein
MSISSTSTSASYFSQPVGMSGGKAFRDEGDSDSLESAAGARMREAKILVLVGFGITTKQYVHVYIQKRVRLEGARKTDRQTDKEIETRQIGMQLHADTCLEQARRTSRHLHQL